MIRRTCRHFVGGSCAVGVAVESLRDAELRLPCHEIRGVSGVHRCLLREWPAPVAAGPGGKMAAALDALTNNRCPNCHETMRGEVEINGVVHAMPCRHVILSPRKEPPRG